MLPTPGRMRATHSDGSLPRHRSVCAGPEAPSSEPRSEPTGIGRHASTLSASSGAGGSAGASRSTRASGSSRGSVSGSVIRVKGRQGGSLWHDAVAAISANDGGRLQLWQALQHKASHREESEGARWLREAPEQATEVCEVLFDELREAFNASPPPAVAYGLIKKLFAACSSHMINREGGRELLLPLLHVAAEHAGVSKEDTRSLMNRARQLEQHRMPHLTSSVTPVQLPTLRNPANPAASASHASLPLPAFSLGQATAFLMVRPPSAAGPPSRWPRASQRAPQARAPLKRHRRRTPPLSLLSQCPPHPPTAHSLRRGPPRPPPREQPARPLPARAARVARVRSA